MRPRPSTILVASSLLTTTVLASCHLTLPKTRIVVVTSPARSHPSTEIIWQTLRSLKYLSGLEAAPILVVCDGCRPAGSLEPEYADRLADRLAVNPVKFSKRGIVADELASSYEDYKLRLLEEATAAGFSPERFSLLELETHSGFAMAVKTGLEHAVSEGSRYALVVQHDRAFCRRVSARTMQQLYSHLSSTPTARYIGFPSGTSKLLPAKMRDVYKLQPLLDARSHELQAGRLWLRPSIFWYDSNHLVDAARALEIYEPYVNAPQGLEERVGGGVGVNRFRLRRGDFIEERFGVEQRNLLASLRDEPDECARFFDWFGTYLVEEVAVEQEEKEEAAAEQEEKEAADDELPIFRDKRGRVTWIDHTDGRGAVPPSQRRAGAPRVLPKRHTASDLPPTPSTMAQVGRRLI